MSSVLPEISVIVPVYNAEKTIATLIEALLNQTYPRNRYEIIFIDNNSTDQTVDIIRRSPVILEEEKNIQSSYAARNRGIQKASHKILAFTDSDCLPAPSWLMEGARAIDKPSVHLAGGPILFSFSKKKTIGEIYDSLMNLDYFYWKTHGMWATANLFVKKSVFDQMGLFPLVISGGDMQWTNKAIHGGFHLDFAPEAIVQHPARHLNELFQKCYRIGRGAPAIWFSQKKSIGYALLKILFSFLPPKCTTLIKKINQRGTPDMKNKIVTLWSIAYICKVLKGFGHMAGLSMAFEKPIAPEPKEDVNVLIGILKYPPDFTGAGQRIHQLYQHLKQKGIHRVYVLTTSPGNFNYRREEINGIKVMFLGNNRFIQKQSVSLEKLRKAWYILVTSFQVYLIFNKHSKSIDVVHTIDSSWLSTLISYLAFFSKKPLIKEIVLLGSDDPLTLKKKVLGQLFLFPFRYARQIIVISQTLKKACLSAGIPESKIWCRHNPVYGLNTADPYIPSYSVREEVEKKILWVGRITPRKNVEFLIRSGRYIEGSVMLTFAGPIYEHEEYFGELKVLAELVTTQTKGRIKIHFSKKTLSSQELSHLYSTSDLFWFASLKEGMGNVVAEALVYGSPVIALPVDGIMRQLLTHPDDGEVVDTNDPKEFAKVVNHWLSKDNIDRRAISNRARNTFNPQPVENGYLNRIRECAGNSR